MTDAEVSDLILDIITKAQEGKAFPYRDILYWREYRYYKKWIFSTRLIIRTLAASAESLFDSYCEDVINGISDVSKLIAYSQLLDIINFYAEDLKTVTQMVADYSSYIEEGNFWYSFLGGRREV